jgi:hypothetical protein
MSVVGAGGAALLFQLFSSVVPAFAHIRFLLFFGSEICIAQVSIVNHPINDESLPSNPCFIIQRF